MLTLPEISTYAQALDTWLEENPDFRQHSATHSLRKSIRQPLHRLKQKTREKLGKELELAILQIISVFHEAGHAAVAYALTTSDEIEDLSIRFSTNQSNRVAGETIAAYVNIPDNWASTEDQIKNDIILTRAAVFAEPKFNNVSISQTDVRDQQQVAILAQKIGWTNIEVDRETQLVLDRPEIKLAIRKLALICYAQIVEGQDILSSERVEHILAGVLVRP